MEITKPFTIFLVMKLSVCISVNLLMPFFIFLIPGNDVGQKRGNDGFILRPPEFHVLPVFLNGFIKYITEIQDSAMFLIPTSFPHIIKHFATQFNKVRIVIPVSCFMQNKPRTFYCMSRIQGSPINMINDAAIRSYLLHYATDLVFYKISFDFIDPF